MWGAEWETFLVSFLAVWSLHRTVERMLRRSGSADKEVRLWQMDPVAKTFNCTHTIEESKLLPCRRSAAPPRRKQSSMRCDACHCILQLFYNYSTIILNSKLWAISLLICLHVSSINQPCFFTGKPVRGSVRHRCWPALTALNAFRLGCLPRLRPGPISKIHVLGGHLFAFTQELIGWIGWR